MPHRHIENQRDLDALMALFSGFKFPFTAEWSQGRDRSLDQNNLMWSLLTDISVAMPLGRRHTPDDWKAIAMNACSWECAFLEGLDGRPFPIGFRSSKLTKSQMSTLIDWLRAFGDENNVKWTDESREAA
jgi:hypothetical protein